MAAAPVAVTGATGFIGGAVVNALMRRGVAARTLVRRGSSCRFSGVEQIGGSLDDDEALTSLVREARAVIHCAGVVRGTTHADFCRVNAEGTRRLLHAAARNGCGRFVLISSLAAREPKLSAYAASKRAAEQILERFAEPVAWSIVRPPAVYGPGDRELMPLFRLMRRGLALQLGPDAARFSLLHVEDMASAVLAVLDADAPGAIFTAHDGRAGGYDWKTVIATAESVWRRRVHRVALPRGVLSVPAGIAYLAGRLCAYRPMLTPGKLREFRHPDWVCDNAGISAATAWTPAYDLADGLRSLRLDTHSG